MTSSRAAFTDSRRGRPGSARPAVLITAVALLLGGIAFGQGLAVPKAHAAQVGTWNAFVAALADPGESQIVLGGNIARAPGDTNNLPTITRDVTIDGQGFTLDFATTAGANGRIDLGAVPARTVLRLRDVTILKTGGDNAVYATPANSANWVVEIENVISGTALNQRGLVEAANASVLVSGTNDLRVETTTTHHFTVKHVELAEGATMNLGTRIVAATGASYSAIGISANGSVTLRKNATLGIVNEGTTLNDTATGSNGIAGSVSALTMEAGSTLTTDTVSSGIYSSAPAITMSMVDGARLIARVWRDAASTGSLGNCLGLVPSGAPNSVDVTLSGAGTELRVETNSTATATGAGAILVQGTGARFTVTDGARITGHSTAASVMQFESDGSVFTVKDGGQIDLVQDGDNGYNLGATLRFRLTGNQTFNVDGGSIAIAKLSGGAPAIRLYGGNNHISVTRGGTFRIHAVGNGTPNTGNTAAGNQGIYYTNSATSASDGFTVSGAGSSVEILADSGPAVAADSSNSGEFSVSSGPGTTFILRGKTPTAASGALAGYSTGPFTFDLDSPLYFDIRNDSTYAGTAALPTGAPAVYSAITTATPTRPAFDLTNSDLSVWQRAPLGKPLVNLDGSPTQAWTLLTTALRGRSLQWITASDQAAFHNNATGLAVAATSGTFLGIDQYARIGANNAPPVIDALRVPTNADKHLFVHSSVPEGVTGLRDAWTDEVYVTVRVRDIQGDVVRLQDMAGNYGDTAEWVTTGVDADHPAGVAVYGEAGRGGIVAIPYKPELAQDTQGSVFNPPGQGFLPAGYTVEVLSAYRSASGSISQQQAHLAAMGSPDSPRAHWADPLTDITNVLLAQQGTSVVTAIDKTPPVPATLSAATDSTGRYVLREGGTTLSGTSEETTGVTATFSVNGALVTDDGAPVATAVAPDGTWTLSLPGGAGFALGDAIQVFLTDAAGNANPAADTEYHDALLATKDLFPAATKAVVALKSAGPAESALAAEPAWLHVGEASTLTATIRDGDGEPVAGMSVAFAVEPGTAAALTVVRGVTDADGTATATLTDAAAEVVRVHATIPWQGVDTDIASSPVAVTFAARTPDAAHSDLTVTPAGPLTVGTGPDSAYTATTTVRDATGYPVAGATVAYAVTRDDGTAADPAATALSAPSCQTDAAGVCAVTLTSTTTGTATGGGGFLVHALIDPGTGTPVDVGTGRGPADPAKDSPARVTYLADLPVAQDATLALDPAVQTATADPSSPKLVSATVSLVDRYGNVPAPGTVVSFALSPAATAAFAGPSACAVTAGGACAVSLYDTKAETVTVTAAITSADGTSVVAQPVGDGLGRTVTFTPGSASAGASELTVDAPTATVGQPITATVWALDAAGNPVGPGATVTFAVDSPSGTARLTGADGTPGLTAACTTGADSRCAVTVTDTVAGETVTLRGFLGGQEIGAGRVPAPDPAIDSPKALTFAADVPDAARSGVTADSPVTVGEASTVTVHVRDRYGNPAGAGTTVALSVTAPAAYTGAAATSTTCTVTAASTCTAAVTSTVAATVTANAAIGGTAVGDGQGVPIAFEAASADAAHSTLEADATTAPVGRPITATVTAYDALGNRLGAGVVFTFTAASASGRAYLAGDGGGATCTTAGDGTCAVTVTDTAAGETVTLRALLGGQEVGTAYAASDPSKASPKTLAFTAGCAELGAAAPSEPDVDNARRSHVRVTTDRQVADGASPDVATVRLFDRYGNPADRVCPGGDDPATAPDAVITTTPAAPVTAAAPVRVGPGVWTIDYVSADPGTTTAAVLANGVGIAFVPQPGATSPLGPAEVAALSSPVSLTFVAGPYDVGRSALTITGGLVAGETPQRQRAGGALLASVLVVDATRNPVPGATVSFHSDAPGALTLDGAAAATCTTGADGTCAVGLTAQVGGPYQIHATLPVDGTPTDLGGDGDPAKRSPQPVRFVAGPVCTTDCAPADGLSHTSVLVAPDNAVVGTTPGNGLVVWAFDAYGNPVAGAAVVLETTDAALALAATTGTTDEAGTWTTTATSAVAGPHAVAVSVDGQTVAGVPGQAATTGSPATLTFVPGAVDATASWLDVSPPSQTAGAPVTVTVWVRDAAGNPITDLASGDLVPLGVADPLPPLAFTGFSPGADGGYTYQTTSLLAGTFALGATVAGVAIDHDAAGSRPVLVSFTAGEVCVSHCTPVGNPATPDVDESVTNLTRIALVTNDALADGRQTDVARAWAYDTYGNPVPGVAFTVTDQTTGPLAGALTPTVQTSAPTGPDGTTTLAWTSTAAGVFTATTTAASAGMTEGVAVSASDLHAIRFAAGDVSAPASTLTIDPATAQPAGSAFTATVLITDATGNPLPGVTVAFHTDRPAKTTVAPATCVTLGDGRCAVAVTSPFAGTSQVHATVGVNGVATELGGSGDPGAASPQPVTFEAGAVCTEGCTPLDDPSTPDIDESAANHTKVVVDPDTRVADGVQQDVLTVYAYDRFGNPVAGAPVVLTSADPALHLVATSKDTDAAGAAAFPATSTAAGAYPVAVSVAGQTPAGVPGTPGTASPAVLHFVAGEVGGVGLAIAPATAQPAGAAFTVTAAVVDAAGNPVAQAAVAATLPPPLAPVGAPGCTTDATGTCTFQVTATAAGSYDVTAASAGHASNAVTAAFTAGPPDAGTSTVVVTTNGAAHDGLARDVVTVTARDRHGNPVPGADVTALLAPGQTGAAANLAVQPAIAPTDAHGQTTVWFTSTAAGAKLADVRIGDGVAPRGSPVRLEFGNGAGSAAHSSWAIAPAGPLTVGDTGTSAYALTATVRDVFDRVVPGAVVTFRVDRTTTAWAETPQTCTTDPEGACSVSVTSTAAGTFAFTAAIPDGQIGAALSRLWTPDAVCGPCSAVTVTANGAVADGLSQDTVRVAAYDRFGNPVPGQVVATATGAPVTVQPGIGFTDAAGVATVWYTSTTAGSYPTTVTLGTAQAVPVPASVDLRFVPGPFSAERSTLTVHPSAPTAGDAVTATVTAKDAHGNPIPGTVITVTVGPSASDALATGDGGRPGKVVTCVTDAQGVCTVTVTDTTAEPITVAAFGPADPVTGAPPELKGSPAEIAFAPGGAGCAPEATVAGARRSQVVVTVDHQKAGGSTPDVAEVRLFDKWGNPTDLAGCADPGGALPAGPAVVASALTPGDPALTIGEAVHVGTGVWTIGYTTAVTTPAEYSPAVTVNGVPVVFVPQPGTAVDAAAYSSPVRLHFVDLTAPAAPVIVSPQDGGLTRDDPVTLAGMGEPGATVAVFDGPTPLCQTTVAPDGTWTCAAHLDDGAHTLHAVQTDPSGNASPPSPDVTVTVDLTAPDPPRVDVADARQIGGGEGAAEPGSTVTVRDASGTVLCRTEAAPDGSWSCATPPGTPSGEIAVTATDRAGNESAPTRAYLDTRAPDPPLVDPTNGSRITGRGEPGDTIAVTDAHGDPVRGCESVTVGEDGRFACTPATPLRPGETVAAVAIDPAGNASAPRAVTVSERTIAVGHPDPGPGEEQTVTGTGFNPGETVTIRVCSVCAVVATVTADGTGSFSASFPLPSGLAAGPHEIQASGATSDAGRGPVTAPFAVRPAIPAGGGVLGGPPARSALLPALLVVLGTLAAGLARRRLDAAPACPVRARRGL